MTKGSWKVYYKFASWCHDQGISKQMFTSVKMDVCGDDVEALLTELKSLGDTVMEAILKRCTIFLDPLYQQEKNW